MDRDSIGRFPVRAAVRYRSLQKGRGIEGTGRCLSLSSDGLLIRVKHPEKADLNVGTRLEIILEWPFLLSKTRAFELVVTGRVVRWKKSTVALSMERHQLRTVKRKPASIADSGHDSQQARIPALRA